MSAKKVKQQQPGFPLFLSACLRMRIVHELIQVLAGEDESVKAAQRDRRPLPSPRIRLHVRDGLPLSTTPLSEIALSFELALKSCLQEYAYVAPKNDGRLNPAGRNHPFPSGTRLPGSGYMLPDQFPHSHTVSHLASTVVDCMQEDGKDLDALATRLIHERHPAWNPRAQPCLPLTEHLETFGGLYNNTVNLRYCANLDPLEDVDSGEMDKENIAAAQESARAEHRRAYPNLGAALQMINNAGTESPRSQRPPDHLPCFRHPPDGTGHDLLPAIFSMLTCLSYWQSIMELTLDKIIEHDAAVYAALDCRIEDVGHSVYSGSTDHVRALGHHLEAALKLFDPETDLGIEVRIKAALKKACAGRKG